VFEERITKTHWAAVAAFLLAVVSVAILYLRYFSPPSIAEGKITTDGFTKVLRDRFPPGTPEVRLIADLQAHGFKGRPSEARNNCEPLPPPEVIQAQTEKDFTICPFANPARTLSFSWVEPISLCTRKLVVGWSKTADDRLVQVNGRYFRNCF
jgi:hypothetical protein